MAVNDRAEDDESGARKLLPDSSHHYLEEDEELATDEEADEYFAELFGYDKWPRDVSIDFDRAMGLTTVKSFRIDFASAVEEYRAVEAEFRPRLADDEANVVELQEDTLWKGFCARRTTRMHPSRLAYNSGENCFTWAFSG
ncbi:MAG: hypothetical protein IPM54_08950 [Polyangiaceae bacterium]|nr:hypothetical protein [Polyangiaceae bacterium]